MADAKIRISAQDKTKSAFSSVNARLEHVAKAAVTVGAAVGGAMAILTAKSMESIDTQAKLSDRIVISTEALAAFNLQGKLSGASNGDVNNSLEKMIKNLGDAAQGFGQTRTLLRAMNVDIDSLARMNTEDQYKAISDAISGLDSPAKQVSATLTIFGRSGRNMLNMIRGGSEAFEAAKRETQAYGTAISRIDAAKVEAANDSMTRAQNVVEGFGNKLAIGLSPFIEAAAKEFVGMSVDAGISGQTIIGWLRKISEAVGFVGDTMRLIEVGWTKIEIAAKIAVTENLKRFALLDRGMSSFLNKIPGLSVKPSADLQKWADDANASLLETYDHLDELTNAPMPSDKISNFFDTVQKKAQEAAAAVAEKIKGGSNVVTIPGFEPLSEKETEALQTKYDALDQSLLAQQERLEAAYLSRQQIIADSIDNGLVTEQRGLALSEKLHADHENALIKLKIKSATSQIATGATMLEQLTAGVATKSRAMFEINKIAATANAIVKGFEAVQSAYAFGSSWGGPIGGAAMAAIAAAATAANVASIQSTSFGGGASVSSGSGGGVPSLSTSPGVPVTSTNGANAGAQQERVILVDDGGKGFFSAAFMKQLSEQMAADAQDGIITRLQVNG